MTQGATFSSPVVVLVYNPSHELPPPRRFRKDHEAPEIGLFTSGEDRLASEAEAAIAMMANGETLPNPPVLKLAANNRRVVALSTIASAPLPTESSASPTGMSRPLGSSPFVLRRKVDRNRGTKQWYGKFLGFRGTQPGRVRPPRQVATWTCDEPGG